MLSKNRQQAEYGGLAVVDCSWKTIQTTFARFKGINRRLPYLIAANPIYYGHVFKLSSLEALAAALYIINHDDQARKILSIYKWGPRFLDLNKNLLEEYKLAKTIEEINKIEKFYFE